MRFFALAASRLFPGSGEGIRNAIPPIQLRQSLICFSVISSHHIFLVSPKNNCSFVGMRNARSHSWNAACLENHQNPPEPPEPTRTHQPFKLTTSPHNKAGNAPGNSRVDTTPFHANLFFPSQCSRMLKQSGVVSPRNWSRLICDQ